MADQPKQRPAWLGHPILDEAHAPQLERMAALYEFHHGMPRHQAEQRALAEYRTTSHARAATYHLAGLKAAHGSGNMQAAQLHHDMYVNHMKQLGLDPSGDPPPNVPPEDQEQGPVYDFRAHPGDEYLVQPDAQKPEDVKKSQSMTPAQSFGIPGWKVRYHSQWGYPIYQQHGTGVTIIEEGVDVGKPTGRFSRMAFNGHTEVFPDLASAAAGKVRNGLPAKTPAGQQTVVLKSEVDLRWLAERLVLLAKAAQIIPFPKPKGQPDPRAKGPKAEIIRDPQWAWEKIQDRKAAAQFDPVSGRPKGPVVNGERFAPGYTPEAAAAEQAKRGQKPMKTQPPLLPRAQVAHSSWVAQYEGMTSSQRHLHHADFAARHRAGRLDRTGARQYRALREAMEQAGEVPRTGWLKV